MKIIKCREVRKKRKKITTLGPAIKIAHPWNEDASLQNKDIADIRIKKKKTVNIETLNRTCLLCLDIGQKIRKSSKDNQKEGEVLCYDNGSNNANFLY